MQAFLYGLLPHCGPEKRTAGSKTFLSESEMNQKSCKTVIATVLVSVRKKKRQTSQKVYKKRYRAATGTKGQHSALFTHHGTEALKTGAGNTLVVNPSSAPFDGQGKF